MLLKDLSEPWRGKFANAKNVYTDKLDDIVNKYNNIYHSTIKMRLVYVKDNTYIDSGEEINDKEHQNTKIFLEKATPQIGLKNFLWLRKLKILCHKHMLLMILMVKKMQKRFMKRKQQEKNQIEFRVEKIIKRKGDKL